MRIKDVNRAVLDKVGVAPAEEKKGSGGGSHSFQRHLSHVSNEDYEQCINDLAEKIYRQGEVVSKRVDLFEYQKYRELIMELLNDTVSNAYAFFKTNRLDSRGRHKVFAVIRKVNKRLDELAEIILSNEAQNIDMLNIVDDIRGMLVDLLM